MNTLYNAIRALYRAGDVATFASSLFALISEELPSHAQILVIRPTAAETEFFCSRPELGLGNELSGEDELWWKPGIDHLVQPFLRDTDSSLGKGGRSALLRVDLMKKTGTEYGLSLVAGRAHAWHAHFMILRTKEQGAFSQNEIKHLEAFLVDFQSALERVTGRGEGEVCRKAFETFLWGFPSAVVVLSWTLKVLYFNASALELCECWRTGLRQTPMKRARTITLPPPIYAEMEKERASLARLKTQRKATHTSLSVSDLVHPLLPELGAKISFYPGHSEILHGGAFLVNLHWHNPVPSDGETFDGFVNLSPRERKVVLLAAQGKKSNDISAELGTAPITVRMQLYSAYKKLGIKSRYELVSRFSHHPQFAGLAARDKENSSKVLSMADSLIVTTRNRKIAEENGAEKPAVNGSRRKRK